MKLLTSLFAFAALAALAAPTSAVAGRSLHGGQVVIVPQRPVVIAPSVSPFFVARARPLFLATPLVVQRPFVLGQPMILQPLVVPRSGVFFTVPRTVVIVR